MKFVTGFQFLQFLVGAPCGFSSNVSEDFFPNVSKDLFSNVSKDLFSKVSEDLFSKGNVFLLQLQPAMHLPRSVGRRRRVQTSCFTTKRIDQLPLALSEA